MIEALPELDEETKTVLIRVVTGYFSDYISYCSDDSFTEFFRATDITQTSFFDEVMCNVEQILGVYWWRAQELISENTKEIQAVIFSKPWVN